MRWIFLLVLMANGFYLLWMETSGAGEAAQQVVAPPPDAPGLVLLSEADGGSAEADSPVEAQAVALASPDAETAVAPVPAPESASQPEPEVEPAGLDVCWQLGPFRRDEDARLVAAAVTEQGWGVSQQVVEVPRPSGYWVYTGPYGSRQQALQQLREYKAQGVDSFLITDGDLANAISLGLFSSREYAAKAQARRRKQGYPAKIYVLERSDEQILLRVSGGEDELDIEPFLQAQKSKLELDAILKKSCI